MSYEITNVDQNKRGQFNDML